MGEQIRVKKLTLKNYWGQRLANPQASPGCLLNCGVRIPHPRENKDYYPSFISFIRKCSGDIKITGRALTIIELGYDKPHRRDHFLEWNIKRFREKTEHNRQYRRLEFKWFSGCSVSFPLRTRVEFQNTWKDIQILGVKSNPLTQNQTWFKINSKW